LVNARLSIVTTMTLARGQAERNARSRSPHRAGHVASDRSLSRARGRPARSCRRPKVQRPAIRYPLEGRRPRRATPTRAGNGWNSTGPTTAKGAVRRSRSRVGSVTFRAPPVVGTSVDGYPRNDHQSRWSRPGVGSLGLAGGLQPKHAVVVAGEFGGDGAERRRRFRIGRHNHEVVPGSGGRHLGREGPLHRLGRQLGVRFRSRAAMIRSGRSNGGPFGPRSRPQSRQCRSAGSSTGGVDERGCGWPRSSTPIGLVHPQRGVFGLQASSSGCRRGRAR
jgi:hypothetical protein